ncbi:MAG: T9SS type A sorting domain-containing protein [Draconibacterium sp.]|nr:T9SS type A sorting domain-containing protein [Draconibacterium sp.]
MPSTHHKYGITSTSFYFDFDYEIVDEGDGWAYVYVNSFDQESTGLVDVEACSSLAEFYVFDLVEGMCGGYFMSLSPNPSNGEVTITLESTSKTRTIDLNDSWELEIRDQSQNLKYKKGKLKATKTKLNTSSWKEGIYFVIAKYKEHFIKSKLVVSKNR